MTASERSRLSLKEWLLVIALVVLCVIVFCVGCSSTTDICATCPPRLETQTIDKEVPCFAPIGALPTLILPALPPPPPDFTAATDEEIEVWLADLKAALEEREALALAHVRAMAEQIAVHNTLEPRCAPSH